MGKEDTPQGVPERRQGVETLEQGDRLVGRHPARYQRGQVRQPRCLEPEPCPSTCVGVPMVLVKDQNAVTLSDEAEVGSTAPEWEQGHQKGVANGFLARFLPGLQLTRGHQAAHHLLRRGP